MSITSLKKPVVRKVVRARGRALVFRMTPAHGELPALFEARELGTRRWYPLPLEALFIHAVRRYVDAEKMRKAKRPRRARLSMIGGVR